MDLGGRDEVHREMPAIQDTKNVHEETMGTGALIAMDVEHHDIVLYGYSRGALRTL